MWLRQLTLLESTGFTGYRMQSTVGVRAQVLGFPINIWSRSWRVCHNMPLTLLYGSYTTRLTWANCNNYKRNQQKRLSLINCQIKLNLFKNRQKNKKIEYKVMRKNKLKRAKKISFRFNAIDVTTGISFLPSGVNWSSYISFIVTILERFVSFKSPLTPLSKNIHTIS